MDNSLLDVRDINHKYIVVGRSYTSQCSPLSPEVGKRYAEPSKRKERGLYRDGNRTYNADAVGAYNILRNITPYPE